MPAGQFPSRVQVLLRVTNTNELGEPEEAFTPAHFLWCRIEEDSPRQATELGGPQTGIDATITLRGYPPIQTTDMLRDCFQRVWKIEGRTTGDREVVLQCYTDDALKDWREDA